MAVTGQDVVEAARELLGAPYRFWTPGALIPMWLADGAGDLPPAAWLKQKGVMCSDLLNYALERCGLPAVGGTEAWYDYLYDNSSWFDPASPGLAGAVAVQNYADSGDQGHIVLYTGEHSIIQAITTAGVTEDYTDQQTCLWPECRFQIYSGIPGVDYSGADGAPAVDRVRAPAFVAVNAQGLLVAEGPDWTRGWWDRDWVWGGPNWGGG